MKIVLSLMVVSEPLFCRDGRFFVSIFRSRTVAGKGEGVALFLIIIKMAIRYLKIVAY